jgi:hypothetical protein
MPGISAKRNSIHVYILDVIAGTVLALEGLALLELMARVRLIGPVSI